MKLEEKIKEKFLYKKEKNLFKIIYFFYQYIKSMKFLKKRIFHSNWGIDIMAEDFFKQKKKGFFVDVGCHQPFLNNNKDMKEFDCIQDAIKYLEQVTGYEMSFELDRKKKKKLIKDGVPSLEANELSKTYDWELIGKLIRK